MLTLLYNYTVLQSNRSVQYVIGDIGPIFVKETKQPLSTLRIVISLLILLHATKAFVLNTFDLRSNLLLFRFTACAKESDSN